MTSAADPTGLALERATLDVEIAALKRDLAHVNARLARPKRRGPGKNSFVWGLLAGMLLVGGAVVAMFVAMMRVLGHMD